MSNLRDGDVSPTEGPARKRRRRRRSRGGPERKATEANGAAESRFRAEKAAVVGAGEGNPDDSAAKPRKRRRRRKWRKSASATFGEPLVRNMRAPVIPVPDVRYDPRETAAGGPALKPTARGRDLPHRGAYAALDLGTNNCRLLIAVPGRRRSIRVIDAFSRIVRLGEGMAATGRLEAGAMERALDALRICAEKLAGHNIAATRLIATEACRQAENGAEFLARVRAETGLELEVVDRETEARLAAEGCGELVDRQAEGAVLFDIGGGSSELVLINRKLSRSNLISKNIVGWASLPLGVVTLAERHGGRDVTRRSFENMVAEVAQHLASFEGRGGLSDIWAPGRTHLLGTSGTVTTIAGVHLGLQRYDRRKVDGIWLSDRQIDKVIEDLLHMDYETRARNPCIGRDRADLVLAGCAILQAIRRSWPSDRLRVADRGLREGMLCQLMQQGDAWLRSRGGRFAGGAVNGQARPGN